MVLGLCLADSYFKYRIFIALHCATADAVAQSLWRRHEAEGDTWLGGFGAAYKETSRQERRDVGGYNLWFSVRVYDQPVYQLQPPWLPQLKHL